MNPPSFTGSSTIDDPQNFTKKLKKVFNVMDVLETENFELAAYQLKVITRTWLD